MEKYREATRAKLLPKDYSGARHLFGLFGLCALTSAACLALMEWQHFKAYELLIVPLALFGGNLAEYFLHKYPLHHSMGFLRFLYRSHSGLHHRFYNYDNFFADNVTAETSYSDFYFTLFPFTSYLLYVAVGAGPLAVITGVFLSRNIALLVLITSVSYLSAYELLHSMAHDSLPPSLQGVAERLIPGAQSIRRHHRLHHHWRLQQKYNFCVTFPFCDYLFNTDVPPLLASTVPPEHKL